MAQTDVLIATSVTPPPRTSARARIGAFAREVGRSKTFLVGAGVLAFWVAIAIIWPLVVPHDPQASDPLAVLQSPSGDHWFGTDDLGRDVFSRVLAGASSALTVAPA